ncbi:hypothetical protein H0H93_010248 [Arthromyces matolae]|nr:hypothetical protein H0H93_010248 [Arthromyces matolae]
MPLSQRKPLRYLSLKIPTSNEGLDSVINILGLLRTAVPDAKASNAFSAWIRYLRNRNILEGKNIHQARLGYTRRFILKGNNLVARKRLIEKVVKEHNEGIWFKPYGTIKKEMEDILKDYETSGAAAREGENQIRTSENQGKNLNDVGQILPKINTPTVEAQQSSRERQHPENDAFLSPVQNTHSHGPALSLGHGGSYEFTASPRMNTDSTGHITGGDVNAHGIGAYDQAVDMQGVDGGLHHTPSMISALPLNPQYIDDTPAHQGFGSNIPRERPSGGIPMGGLPDHSYNQHLPLQMSIVHSQDGQKVHRGSSGVGIPASNMDFTHTTTDHPQDGLHEHGYNNDIGSPMGEHPRADVNTYHNDQSAYGGGLV